MSSPTLDDNDRTADEDRDRERHTETVNRGMSSQETSLTNCSNRDFYSFLQIPMTRQDMTTTWPD